MFQETGANNCVSFELSLSLKLLKDSQVELKLSVDGSVTS